MSENLTSADLEWLEREKFIRRPHDTDFTNRAAHNARIDRILAACRQVLEPGASDGT